MNKEKVAQASELSLTQKKEYLMTLNITTAVINSTNDAAWLGFVYGFTAAFCLKEFGKDFDVKTDPRFEELRALGCGSLCLI